VEREAITQRVSQEFSRLLEKMPFAHKRDLERLDERLRRLEARSGVDSEDDASYRGPAPAGD
jgi:hypothetical protein